MEYNLIRIKYQFDKVAPDFVIVSHASNSFGLIAPEKKYLNLLNYMMLLL